MSCFNSQNASNCAVAQHIFLLQGSPAYNMTYPSDKYAYSRTARCKNSPDCAQLHSVPLEHCAGAQLLSLQQQKNLYDRSYADRLKAPPQTSYIAGSKLNIDAESSLRQLGARRCPSDSINFAQQNFMQAPNSSQIFPKNSERFVWRNTTKMLNRYGVDVIERQRFSDCS
jgi:hypothetical protein